MARRLSTALYRVGLGALDETKLYQVSDDASVVFVINHRSNMDYVLVTYLVSQSSALSYAVGEWARVWALQSLIRAMGGYFVRRDSSNPLYRKVLDANPSSVEALTGLGYCHLDRKEFASAHTRFRAALGISSRYQSAMWGIAEAYEQQGLKEQAIERYQAFVDAHAGSSRVSAARQKTRVFGM